MCSLMLSLQAAPTSASLVLGAYCDICPPVHERYEVDFNPPHMNWVLVDDTKANPRAQVRWVVDR
jgi:hypothetical protein